MDGVLAHLDRNRRLEWLSRITGKTVEHLSSTIWDSDFETSAEAGRYPIGSDYLAEFNNRSECTITREQWIEARRQAMTLIPETLEIAHKLNQEVDIAMLTNNGSLLKESLPELVPEIRTTFGKSMHASFEFNARKPDPQVFYRLLAKYSIRCERALLIDDDLENVIGAQQAGLQALHFKDPITLNNELLNLGLLSGIKAHLPGCTNSLR